jgi:hypothetical protein
MLWISFPIFILSTPQKLATAPSDPIWSLSLEPSCLIGHLEPDRIEKGWHCFVITIADRVTTRKKKKTKMMLELEIGNWKWGTESMDGKKEKSDLKLEDCKTTPFLNGPFHSNRARLIG